MAPSRAASGPTCASSASEASVDLRQGVAVVLRRVAPDPPARDAAEVPGRVRPWEAAHGKYAATSEIPRNGI